MSGGGGGRFVDSVLFQLEERSNVLMERDEWLPIGRELLFADSVFSEGVSGLGSWIDNEAFRSSSHYELVKMETYIRIGGGE